MAVSKTLRYQVLRRDNFTCQTCGRGAPEVKLHVDHVVPEALGGRTEPANLQTLCADCNSGKSATPADASRVEQVSADAARWAQAQRLVAAEMVAALKGRSRIYNKFDRLWKEYGDVYRPADWRRSLDQFLDAGLPPEMILHAAETALGKSRVRAGDCFKYMCGIAWARIADIRDATHGAVSPPARGPAASAESCSRADRDMWEMTGYNTGRTELADQILEEFTDDQRRDLLIERHRTAIAEGDELDESEGQETPYLVGRAALAAFNQFRIRALRMDTISD